MAQYLDELPKNDFVFLTQYNNYTELKTMTCLESIGKIIQYVVKPYGWAILSECAFQYDRLDVYVLPEFRNKGYGRKLVETIKPHIKNSTQVSTSNIDRLKFYKSVFQKPEWKIRTMKCTGKSYAKYLQ